MESVFVHHGEDRRHLGDLVSDRLGVITGQGIAAPAASGRLAVDDLADLLGGYERAGLAMMAGLPVRFQIGVNPAPVIIESGS